MVANAETEFDFLGDLESLQQPQPQEQPQSKIVQLPTQKPKPQPQQQQPEEIDFIGDLLGEQQSEVPSSAQQPQTQLPQAIGSQQAQAEVPDFLGDFEAQPTPAAASAKAQPAEQRQSQFPFLPKSADTSGKPKTEVEKKQSRLLDQFSRGLQESASGEIAQQFFQPGTQQQLEQDPTFWESLVHEAGTVTGDLPYLAAGATLGASVGGAIGSAFPGAGNVIGAIVGGGFGATSFPAFLKESLKQYRDFQESGGDLTFGQFLQRADKVANKTLNEGLFGAILGTVKRAIPILESTPGIGKLFSTKLGKTAGTITGEATVATVVPAAAQGRLPEKEDFAKALALFAGFNLAMLPANAREAIERQGQSSGLTPEEFARSYDPEQAGRIKKVVEQNIYKEAKREQLPEKPSTEAKAAELPKGSVLRKPEDIRTGTEGGKAVANISVEGEEGGYFPHKIELTKEEKTLIDASNSWEKAGDHREAGEYAQKAREAIFNRLTGKEAAPKAEKPPETRGQGKIFHGTPVEIETPSSEHYSSLNYYGQGFYTTDALDIAQGYSKRSTRGVKKPTIYEVTPNRDLNLIDMEKPLTELDPKAQEVIQKMAKGKYGADIVVQDALEENPQNLRELYDEIRDIGTGEGFSADTIQETFDSLRENFERAGYDGMKHIGGLRTGKKPHEVKIYFNPEKNLSIKTYQLPTAKLELSAPKAEGAKVTKLYHGTRESFDKFDFNKSGGMAFFATEPEVAERYAKGGGGGRQKLTTKNSFFEDEEGNLYQFDDAAKEWKPLGRFKEGSYPSEENLELFSEKQRKELPAIPLDKANRLAEQWQGGFTPKKSRIVVQNYNDLNILDLKTKDGMEKIAKLSLEGVKDPLVRSTIQAARDDLANVPGTNFNTTFWGNTKYLSKAPEAAAEWKKRITDPLEKMGYDGVAFQDDQHPSIALFESARRKAPLSERARKEQRGATIPPALQRILPQPPKEPIKALKEVEATQAAPQGRTLDEAVSFEAKEPKPKAEPKSEFDFRRDIVDDLYPIKRFVESAGVEDLPISEDPYRLARLYRGWSGKVETFLEFRTFDPIDLKWKGPGLRRILSPVRDDLEGFSKFLVAKRALEIEGQGKQSGIDLNDARAYVRDNEAKYEKPAKQLKKYQSDLLHYAERSGLISPETRELWETMNENYVPMQRVLEEPTEEFVNARTMQPKKQFFELKGSKKPIIDPLESIIQNSYTLIRASEQNRVLRALRDFDEKYKGSKEFVEVKEIGESESSLKNFSDFLKGEDVVEKDGTVRFFDNGKLVKLKVTPEVGEALKGIRSAEELNFIGRMLNYPTRAVRLGAITLSPGTLLKLGTIDQLEAFLYSQGYVPYYDAAKGLFHALKKDALYYTWKKAGGDQSIATSLARSFKQQKLHKIATGKNTFDSVDSLLRAVENVSKPLEESTRLGVFEKALKRKGMSADDLREAALEAREATLDFQRKGARTKLMAQAVPFFNASIQGASKFFEQLKKEPAKLTAKAITTVTLPTLANYYLNKDRKEFQELPQWERDSYWHFYVDLENGETQHYKMPRPFELGAVFATIPERLAEYAYEKDKNSLNAIGENLKDVFLPSVMPAALAPIYETATNKRLLSGAPIESERLKKLPVEERHGPFTSETAKKLSPILQKVPFIGSSASPVMIEEWINSMSGGLGSALIHYSEKALEKTGVLPEKIRPEQELADLPIFKVFVGKKGYTKNAQSIRRFYAASDTLQQQYNSIRNAGKEGRETKIENPQEVVAKHKRAQKVRQAFSKSWTAIRNIEMDNDPTHYSASEKKILIDALIKDMVNVSRDVLKEE